MSTSVAPAEVGGPIHVPNPPRIPGFRLRHYRGPQDHPGMIRANTRARQAAGILERVSVEGMDSDYANLHNSDRYCDVIVGELDGEIVSYGRIEWGDNTDGARDYSSFCLVEPSVRRQGIGSAMLGWQEQRIREIAAEQQTDRPRFYFSFVYDTDAGARALLERSGYSVVRRGAEMVRPNLEAILDAPMPEGLEIRPAGPEHVRGVWEAAVDAFRDHWGSHEDSEDDYRTFASSPKSDPATWVVAWAGDEIAGFVLGSVADGEGPDEVVGYFDSVGVRRPWRRRGLGRALCAAALRRLRERGATTVGLGVDLKNQNEAARLYESVGFQIRTTSTEYRKPLVL
jgi:mycothiol synthase